MIYEYFLYYLIGFCLGSILMYYNDEDQEFTGKQVILLNLFFWYVILIEWLFETIKKSLRE